MVYRKGPSDMDIYDTFELEYKGQTLEIKYNVYRGLEAGGHDHYYFEAKTENGVKGTAYFLIWRSNTRVAKIAAKHAIKNEQRQKGPSTVQKIKNQVQ